MKNLSASEIESASDVAIRRWALVYSQAYLSESLGISHNNSSYRLGVPHPTLCRWRRRFEREGLAGLAKSKSTGRPRKERITQTTNLVEPCDSIREDSGVWIFPSDWSRPRACVWLASPERRASREALRGNPPEITSEDKQAILT